MKEPIIFILVQLLSLISANIGPSEYFDQIELLAEPDNFLLFWKSNETHIIFEAHVKTFGWTAFGITSTGLWGISDLIVAWTNDDGTGHFSDRHITNNSPMIPVIDSTQNWFPIYLGRKAQYTVIKFIRKFIANEDNEDLSIISENVNVIYGWGDSFSNGDILVKANDLKRADLNLINVPVSNESPQSLDSISKDLQIKPSKEYDSSKVLVENMLHLYWSVVDGNFFAELHARTNGWVMFGFGHQGDLNNSDVFVGWIKNQKATFIDSFIENEVIVEDKSQDWHLVSSYESNNYTMFKFERKIVLCGENDITIESGSPYVVFSWSNHDPVSNTTNNIKLHNNKNSGVTQIVARGNQKTHSESSKSFIDFQISNIVLSNDAPYFYYCKLFKVSEKLSQKMHIYKWELIKPKSHDANIQHIIVYECDKSFKGEPKIHSGDCQASSEKKKHCHTASIGSWFRGGNTVQYLPHDTGYPIGGNTDYKHILIEIHYEPETSLLNKISYIDNLTIRYFITDKLMPNELGVLRLGTESDPIGIMIPPKQESFKIKSFCSNKCIGPNLKNKNITLIRALPHTHLLGRKVTTRLIRENNDLGYLDSNEFYSFYFQNSYNIEPRINLTKNDDLITECTYSTMSRSTFTFGGLDLNSEVCQHYFLYYPRNSNFKFCESFSDIYDQYEFLAKLEPKHGNESDPLEPYQSYNSVLDRLYEGYKVLQHMLNVPEELVNKLRAHYDNSAYYSICQKSSLTKSTKIISFEKNAVQRNECEIETTRKKGHVRISSEAGRLLTAYRVLFVCSSVVFASRL